MPLTSDQQAEISGLVQDIAVLCNALTAEGNAATQLIEAGNVTLVNDSIELLSTYLNSIVPTTPP